MELKMRVKKKNMKKVTGAEFTSSGDVVDGLKPVVPIEICPSGGVWIDGRGESYKHGVVEKIN